MKLWLSFFCSDLVKKEIDEVSHDKRRGYADIIMGVLFFFVDRIVGV